MLGHVTESIDYNLPVDAITRKPVFAFSCNRRIRESYNGPLLRTVDGDVYPADLEASVGKKIVKIYDQKVRFNCPAFNVEAVGDVFLRKKIVNKQLPDFELPTAPNNGSDKDYTFAVEDRPKIIILKDNPNKGFSKGDILTVNLLRFQSSGFILRVTNPTRFIGNRGQEYEVVAPTTLYYLELSPGAYFEPTESVPDPNYQLPTEAQSGNDYIFPAEEKPLVVSLKTDSDKGLVEGEIYKLRRFRVSNMNGQIENLDGTYPRYIGIRGAGWEILGAGMATFFTEDAGVLTVCDPSNSAGRAPIFSASNSENELCFDVGSAYMRINHYKISERHQLFGGLDSPDQEYNAYLGNFSEKTVIRNSSGFSGVSLRKDAISSGLTDAYIGRDATGNTYSGEIYELIIGDFEIPNDSVNEAFRDMIDFYALT